MTRRLIETVFAPAFAHDATDFVHDGAVLDPGGGRLAFTTDTYVVRPLFFPGGDIGALAVNGTVNDLAMCGAEALWLSVGFVLEEGLPIADLRRVVASMRDAAAAAGARIVTGDTKVVERGKGDGLYVNTSGVGRVIATQPIAPARVRAGDVVLLSGDVGRHGVAIMAVREGLGFESEIASDCAPLIDPVRELLGAGIDIHCLRDLTRGGLATALVEIAGTAGLDLPPRRCKASQSPMPCAAPARSSASIRSMSPTKAGSSPSCPRPMRRRPSPYCGGTTPTPPSLAGPRPGQARC